MNKIFPESDPLEEFGTSIKDYLEMRKQEAKLHLVEHLSFLSARIVNFLLVLVVGSVSIFFLTSALSIWLCELIGSDIAGPLIVGGIFLIALLIIIMLRKKMFTDSMVRVFIEIFFNNKKYGKK